MKKHSWLILVCTVIALAAGAVVAKSQPPAYTVNSTLLATSVPTFGPGTNTQVTSDTKVSIAAPAIYDAAELSTRAVMSFVFQSQPELKAHGFTMDDLLVNVTAANPTASTSTILLTATARKPANAVLLVNAVANGYVAYKTRQIQDQLTAQRTYLQNLYNQYQIQSAQLEKQILSYNNSSDPHIALLTADRNAVITSMNSTEAQLLQLPSSVHADVFVIQPAKIKDVTPSSKALLYLGIIAASGLLIGLLIWLLMIYLDYRLQTDDQVPEKFGLNYLGTLSKDKEIQPGSIPTAGLAAQQLADISVNLRLTGVLPGSWRAPEGAVLLMSSVQPEEGKTTVATGLAAVAARAGRSVLVIDANLRQPVTHLAFGLAPNDFGLSGLLRANSGQNLDAAAQRTHIPGVWLIAGGTAIDNPTTLLEESMPAILAQVRKKTDLVIIDGPPLLGGAEASLLAIMSDGVAMVVGYEKVALLLKARAILRSLSDTPLGVIMNRVSTRKHNPYFAMTCSNDAATEDLLPV
jgi:polysaccharide biosynthesis transport protein